MLDLAIVGGGPGGLMSAWYLKRKLGDLCKVTIFVASDRLGGKIVTRRFDSAPAMYEAGVAEIYDYSMTGPDPLRELIQHFGLQTIPMDAMQVQLDGQLIDDVPGLRRNYGATTASARTTTSTPAPISPPRSCSTRKSTIPSPSASSRRWRAPISRPRPTTP